MSHLFPFTLPVGYARSSVRHQIWLKSDRAGKAEVGEVTITTPIRESA